MSLKKILMAAAGQATGQTYIEDVFSTYLYTGNGGFQIIPNDIPLVDTAQWTATKLYEPASTSRVNTVLTDTSGNLYVAGYADDGTRDPAAVVAKYNSSGTLQWQRKFYDANIGNEGKGIGVDSSGNVYVAGVAFNGTASYGVVVKYNSSGTLQWQRKLTEATFLAPLGLVCDSSGTTYVIGYMNDGTRIGSFIAKYNSSGTIQWQRKIYQTGNSAGGGAVIDSSGNVYFVGNADDGTRAYGLIIKYNSSGTLQWQRKLYQNNSYIRNVTIDSSNNIYVVGQANDGTRDYGLIAKYNSSGTIQWQRKMYFAGSPYPTYFYGITIDGSSNLYVEGYFEFGSNYYTLLAKYNSSGTLQWNASASYVNPGETGIAVDSSGNLYASGDIYDGTWNYGIFLKLAQDGSTTSGEANGALLTDESPLSEAAGTATDAAGTATDAAGTATDATGVLTDAAGTATSSTATQAAVTGVGGLVWLKARTSTGNGNHVLYDTVRGMTASSSPSINTNLTEQAAAGSYEIQAQSNGFSLLSDPMDINTSGSTYASWTFAKQPKFFDIVTYTGTGSNRTISHNLGAVPGCIMVKRTDATGDWQVYHRSTGNTKYLVLNSTAAEATSSTRWNNTTPTSTVFSLGTDATVNASGGTYVAYIFGHDTSSEGIIQCGSFTTDGSGNATVDLGWEPQWIVAKSSNATGSWIMLDTIRGMTATTSANASFLYSETSGAESATTGGIAIGATGFSVTSSFYGNSNTIPYIAIRRGPMQAPTDGTEVFAPITWTGTGTSPQQVDGAFPVDWSFIKIRANVATFEVESRLMGFNVGLETATTSAEFTNARIAGDSNVGLAFGSAAGGAYYNQNGNSNISYFFRRAPKFFDVICFTATTGTNTAAHNLTVEPELVIFKGRDIVQDWFVGTKLINSNSWGVNSLTLNSNASVVDEGYTWMSATSTEVQTFSTYLSSGYDYVAYLFATCPGVSKVGTYTGTGSTLQVNCGFTAGARFVLIKRTDSTGDWYVYDSARGIVSGNDPYLLLNSTAAEVTNTDWVDVSNAGFELSSAGGNNVNINTATYIFLAIA